MLGTGYIKLKLKDLIPVMLVLIVFGIPVYVFNAIAQQDYMFTYDGSWLPIDVSFISCKPLYTALVLIVYAVLALLVIGIDIGVRKLYKKKKTTID